MSDSVSTRADFPFVSWSDTVPTGSKKLVLETLFLRVPARVGFFKPNCEKRKNTPQRAQIRGIITLFPHMFFLPATLSLKVSIA
jgi:hypothetical protein